MDIRNHEIIFPHLISQFLALILSINVDKALVHINIPKDLNQVLELMLLR